jgi:DNA polymerase III epsilon subunit-like protein
MQYKFFSKDDDSLIEISELPTDKGIAVAVHTTGYELERSEIIELAICDLDGKELFLQRVKPQNVEEWQADEASGGIAPADVADAPELFQFEDEISGLFENAGTVVCQHLQFVQDVLESSWVTIPNVEGCDLVKLFCATHCTTDFPNEPATTAALPGIAAYYGLNNDTDTLTGEAALIAACYRALVAEHAAEREAKGTEYWQRYDDSKAGERAELERRQANVRMREHRLNQINGLLWIAGAIIFTSLAIQLYQRNGDMGVIVIAGAIAVFTLWRGIVNFRK